MQSPFREDFIQNSRGKCGGLNLVCKGTDHNNFSDILHMASKFLLMKPAVLGRGADPNVTGEALDRLLVAFFSCLAYSKTFPTALAQLGLGVGNRKPAKSANEQSPLIPPDGRQDLSSLIDIIISSQYDIQDKLGSNFDIIDESVKRFLLRSLKNAKNLPHCYDTHLFNRINHPSYNNDA